MLTNNPRRFWRVINPMHNPDMVFTDQNGEIITARDCSELLNKTFSSVFYVERFQSQATTRSRMDVFMPEIIITEAGTYSLLTKLKISFSAEHWFK